MLVAYETAKKFIDRRECRVALAAIQKSMTVERSCCACNMRLQIVFMLLLLMMQWSAAGKIKDMFKKSMKIKACKQKVTAITIPTYKYVPIPFAREVATLKVNKHSVYTCHEFDAF